MNKQYLIAFLGVLMTAVLAYFVQTSRLEAEKVNENFNKLSLQSIKQSENIADNSKQVKLLLEKISELRDEGVFSALTNKTIEPVKPLNAELELKLSKISTELSLFKKQMVNLQDTKANLSASPEVNDPVVEDPQTVMQAREEKMRQEIETMESTYETVLSEGEADINWTSDIEAKIEKLIAAKEIGDNVQLQEVECRTNLCKVYFSHPDQTSLDDNILMQSLGDVTTYLNYRESSTPGQKEYVMYITKEGENLPPVERN